MNKHGFSGNKFFSLPSKRVRTSIYFQNVRKRNILEILIFGLQHLLVRILKYFLKYCKPHNLRSFYDEEDGFKDVLHYMELVTKVKKKKKNLKAL